MKEQPNFLYGKDSRFLASIEQKIVKEEAEIREKYQIPKEVTIYKDNENVWRVFSDSRKVTVERWYLENEAFGKISKICIRKIIMIYISKIKKSLPDGKDFLILFSLFF